MIADVKHFAANNQETGRFTVDEIIDERTLREIYLPHFEAAVRRGHVGTVMTAYNKVNGAYMGANRPLVRDTLFGDVRLRRLRALRLLRRRRHGRLGARRPEPRPPAAAVLRARRCCAPRSPQGRLTAATIDDLVRRYLRVLFRFGVFDRAAYPARRRRSRSSATGGWPGWSRTAAIVLLRNRRSLLPLNARRIDSVAVIGKSASEYQRPNAASSGGVTPFYSVTAAPGHAARRARALRRPLRRRERPPARRPGRAPRRRGGRGGRARRAVGRVLGPPLHRPRLRARRPPHQDRAHPRGRGGQPADGGGAPVTRAGARCRGSAAWAPSSRRGGPARRAATRIADVLLGKVNPSGKLPVTYPRALTRRARAHPARSSRAWAAARSTRRACWWATAGTTGAASGRCSRSATASPTRASTTATSRSAS